MSVGGQFIGLSSKFKSKEVLSFTYFLSLICFLYALYHVNNKSPFFSSSH